MTYDATLHKCKACKEPVIWMKTRSGKSTPVDAGSIKTDETIFNPKTMTSHFATCKFAASFRKAKKESRA